MPQRSPLKTHARAITYQAIGRKSSGHNWGERKGGPYHGALRPDPNGQGHAFFQDCRTRPRFPRIGLAIRPAVKVGDTALAHILHDHHKHPPPGSQHAPLPFTYCSICLFAFFSRACTHAPSPWPVLICFYCTCVACQRCGWHFVNELQGKTPLKNYGTSPGP